MADESWEQIHGRLGPVRLPAPPAVAIPPVRQPKCPDHCSGRHEIEAQIGCAACGGVAYRVVAHEWFHDSGHWWYETQPAEGREPYDPKRSCACGRPMRRL